MIVEPERKDYKNVPRSANFVTACSSSGVVLYLPKVVKSKSSGRRTGGVNLLGFDVLMEIENIKRSGKVSKGDKGEDMQVDLDKSERLDGNLWVDKYSPKLYIDLVGDERTNREVLSWVKEWDFCVFGKQPKKVEIKSFSKHSKLQVVKDHLHRPEKKVLMLTGPPGMGKTTLAHIVGKHSGYNIVEINASDDRTGEILKNKLLGALQTQSVMGNKKPNLLVIDEIDGASSGGHGDQNFMKVLVDLVTAVNVPPGESAGGSGKNGLYATVLKPLKPHCKIIPFRTLTHKSLSKRLQEICKWEGLKSDVRAISTLCEITDGDIRTCLNTLQFVKKKSGVFSGEVLESVKVGQKDVQRGLFSVWEAVFTVESAMDRKGKVAAGVVNSLQDRSDDESRFVTRLASMVSANGDYNKIMQVFDTGATTLKRANTLTSHQLATSLTTATKTEQALDWIYFYEVLDKKINGGEQMFEMYQYYAYPIVAFHQLFATGRKPERIEFPREDYEYFLKTKDSKNILSSFKSNLDPMTRRNWPSMGNVVTELLPSLLNIISPEIRTINIQLIKPQERQVLTRLVEVMVSFGLEFLQARNEQGNYSFSLEPSMDKLVEPFTTSKFLNITYAVRQLISQEIEKEKIRRTELFAAGRARDVSITTPQLFDTAESVPIVKEKVVKSGKQAPKKLEDLQKNASIKEGKSIHLDFFGRPVVVSATST
ncbi:hypothetical protein HK098_007385, partial [Nowakowskiella sp. JEL0407]